MTTVISGPGQPDIGKNLATLLNANHIFVSSKFFPDGERDLIFSSEACDKKTIIVQSLIPPQDSNLLSLLQIAFTAKEFGAKDITLVTPYLAYGAKDRRIISGEVVSIINILRVIEASPAKRHIIIDIHNPKVLIGKEKFFQNITAMSDFGIYFTKKNLHNPLVLAPDLGAKERASIVSKEMCVDIDFFEKKRDPKTGETTLFPHEIHVKNRDVIIVDEVIRTGGTIIKSIQVLKKMSVRRIFVAATHLMLIDNADEKIIQAGAEEIIGTDSIPSKYSLIPTAPIIKKKIENL